MAGYAGTPGGRDVAVLEQKKDALQLFLGTEKYSCYQALLLDEFFQKISVFQGIF